MRKYGSAAALRALVAGVIVCAMGSGASAQSLPAPWMAEDVGGPILSGSTTFGTGTASIDAGGTDISGSADQFHFLYQAVSGDVDIVARIDSLSPVSPWTVAGVMVRASLAAHAAHAYAAVTPDKGILFRNRPSTGAGTSQLTGPAHKPPTWLRLIRQGTVIKGYASADGGTWTAIGSSTVPLGSAAYVGVAVTSRQARNRTTAVVSNVSVTPIGLPAGQHSTDIGSPGIPGDVYAANGSYTITGAGHGLAGRADQFHFVYQPVTGNMDVVARVASITATSASGAAGVTIRESLAAESRHATFGLTRGNGYGFQARLEPAADTLLTPAGAAAAPGWVRLVRTGDLFEAYRSADGLAWTKVAAEMIFMTETVYVGLAVASGSVSEPSSATIDSLTITATPPTGNRPPAVSVVSPAAGAQFTMPATITISATASDPENRMLAVDFFADWNLIGRVTTAPYSVAWSPTAAGTYYLTAVAHDADGESTISSAVPVDLLPRVNQPPSVSLATNGTAFTAPATITLTATASDADGHIARVEFFAGSTRLNTDTTAPYTFGWTGVSAGTYSVTAIAYDNDGGNASSAPVLITVQAPAAAAPARSPFGGTAVSLPGVIQAENFDEGGAGVAYFDSDAGNNGAAYRTTDVDIEVTTDAGGGHNVGWVTAGEWLEYTVSVSTAGTYTLQARVAGTAAGGTFHVRANGVNVTGPLAVPNTGGWQSFQTVTAPVTLSAGLQVIRLAFDTNATNGFVGNVNWLSFVQATPPAAPGGLTAGASSSAVALAWTDNSSNETGFVVERQTGNGSFAVLTTVGTNVKTFTDTTVAAGTSYGYRVKAINDTGASAYSNTAAVTTAAANKSPVVSLSTSGTTFTAPATITLTASASDSDGQIARVEFYAGSTLLNTDTTAPYSFGWSGVPAGTYTLTAVAFDNQGASASSAPVQVTVSAALLAPPRYVAFVASSDHATNVTKYVLKVYAATANPATATPLATSDMGKPTPAASGEITVDRATFFTSLAAGNYLAVVTAVGPGGETPSASVAFTR